jgi:biopolymer transport protein ExbB
MPRSWTSGRAPARLGAGLALTIVVLAGGADGPAPALDVALKQAERLAGRAAAWYRRTPAADRITWGGLAAGAALGLGVTLERLVRLRRRRVLPPAFVGRFLERLREGKLDRFKALDLCELNPSPASRVTLAAIRRWGRPAAEIERAVGLAGRRESDQLRRNVGTLRRVAALAPLLGLLGTLASASRALAGLGTNSGAAWGPALAAALNPLIGGVALATLALVVYDGLAGKVEALSSALDRLGAETADAVAIASITEARADDRRARVVGPARTPHQVRVEIPESIARAADRDDDR